MTDSKIINPYEDVDFSSAGKYRFQLHTCHISQITDNDYDFTAHEKIDALAGDGPDVAGTTLPERETLDIFGPSNNSLGPLLWPWDELSDINSDWEDRDPEEVGGGVVNLPVDEQETGEHVMSMNTTIDDYEGHFEDKDRSETIEEILTRDEFFLDDEQPLATIAHPGRYRSSAEEYTEYIDDYETWSLEDGLIGFECCSKESGRRLDDNVDMQLWDNLLDEFLGRNEPRWIWGFSDDDGFPCEWGDEERTGRDGVRFNTMFLPESDFDPSNQEPSRLAFVDGLKNGIWVMHERDGSTTEMVENDEMPEVPEVSEISVSGDTITLDASGYDVIEWVSSGEVVGTGEYYTVGTSDVPYVRAQLFSGEAADMTGTGDMGNGIGDAAETYTQPFAVDADGKGWSVTSPSIWSSESGSRWTFEQS